MVSVSTHRAHLHVTAHRDSQGHAARQMWMSASHTHARMMVPAWMIRAPFVVFACQVSRHLVCYSVFQLIVSVHLQQKLQKMPLLHSVCLHACKSWGNPIFLWKFVLLSFKIFVSTSTFGCSGSITLTLHIFSAHVACNQCLSEWKVFWRGVVERN
jgi:hypothetical protein